MEAPSWVDWPFPSMPAVVLAAVAMAVLVLGALLFARHYTKPIRPALESENSYVNPQTQERLPFPSLFDPPSLDLSLIVPCFNEEKRLGKSLDSTLAFLRQKQKQNPSFDFEIIIVDDGSRDGTADLSINHYVRVHGCKMIRVLRLVKNRGKGGAITQGVLRCRGRYILFADADGATAIEGCDDLMHAITKFADDRNCGVVCGSRAHLETMDVVVKRSRIRNALMRGFHILVALLGRVSNVRDTQCGFKMFTREAATLIFPALHVEGWIFDVELLYIANCLKIPVVEVPVNWTEVAGSKVNLVSDSVRMFRDLLVIRINYMSGVWSASAKKTN